MGETTGLLRGERGLEGHSVGGGDARRSGFHQRYVAFASRGRRKLFTGTYAPSTLGSFLRAFTFGHARQLEAAASRWLRNLSVVAPIVAGIDELASVDIDDTIKKVCGHLKEGVGFGYSRVRGLNALLAIVSTGLSAPIIIGCRFRKGPTNSARGAAKFVFDVVKAVKRNNYPIGVKIPDQEMKALETNGTLTRHQFHPEWNYTLNPTQHDTPDAS
jgi:hypothetical protein